MNGREMWQKRPDTFVVAGKLRDIACVEYKLHTHRRLYIYWIVR